MSNLKTVRENKKISRTDLAYKAGISERYVFFLETGERKPSLDLAFKIAKILGVKIEDIFLPPKCTKCT